MKKGIIYGIGAYLMWGFFPVFIKQLGAAPSPQILAHRITWSFAFLFLVLLIMRQWGGFRKSVTGKRTILLYTASALLLAANWLTYIIAVNTDHVIESSLGYFINPLVSVMFGVIFLHERLRNFQWLAVGIAALGVAYLTFDYGSLPWIALILAVTFGLYGLIKKVAPLSSLNGLTLETSILLLPALVYLGFVQVQGEGVFGAGDARLTFFLAISGVITAIPLLMFSEAAHRIPLSMVGLLQYIAPTCQFLLGVLVYQEAFSPSRLVGFVIIWSALGLFWVEGYFHQRSLRPVLA